MFNIVAAGGGGERRGVIVATAVAQLGEGSEMKSSWAESVTNIALSTPRHFQVYEQLKDVDDVARLPTIAGVRVLKNTNPDDTDDLDTSPDPEWHWRCPTTPNRAGSYWPELSQTSGSWNYTPGHITASLCKELVRDQVNGAICYPYSSRSWQVAVALRSAIQSLDEIHATKAACMDQIRNDRHEFVIHPPAIGGGGRSKAQLWRLITREDSHALRQRGRLL